MKSGMEASKFIGFQWTLKYQSCFHLERTNARGLDKLPCKAVLDTALPHRQVTLLQLDALEGPAIKGNVAAETVLL